MYRISRARLLRPGSARQPRRRSAAHAGVRGADPAGATTSASSASRPRPSSFCSPSTGGRCSNVLSAPERARPAPARDDRKHYDALVPLLGEAAPVASASTSRSPKGAFDSARGILREAVSSSGCSSAPSSRALRRRRTTRPGCCWPASSRATASTWPWCSSALRSGPRSHRPCHRPLGLEDSGIKLDAYLSVPGFDYTSARPRPLPGGEALLRPNAGPAALPARRRSGGGARRTRLRVRADGVGGGVAA